MNLVSLVIVISSYISGVVAQCLELLADDREVAGSNPSGAASNLGQVRLPHIACVFWDDTLYAVSPFYMVHTSVEAKYRNQGVIV